MEHLELILSLAATILGLLITTATFLLKLIRAGKAKVSAESKVILSQAIIPYIEQAEKQNSYTGGEKKEYVISQICQFALEHNIELDLMSLEQT